MLPLTFAEPADYDRVGPRDTIAILGLAELAPGKPLTVRGTKPDGKTYTFAVNHTFNANQIGAAAARCLRLSRARVV
jgi:aconitate hydratase